MQSRARIVIGRDGRIALINKSAESLLGVRATDLLGASTEELVPERHRELHVQERDRYFAEPWSPRADYGFYFTLIERGGTEKKLFALPEPIASEDGLWVSIALCLPEEKCDVEIYALRASSNTPTSAWAMEPKPA